jgi:DNA-directed RNA polymerase subunit beta'
MRVEDGDKIKRGQRIAEWDPYTRPILTEVEGSIAFEDLVDGLSMSEALDESTGIAKRVVVDWRTGSSRNQQDLRPAIVIKSGNKLLKLARGGDARYVLAVDAILSVDPGAHVKAGDVIARIPTESAKTRDITGGLPRVAELFEARKPKDAAVIAEISGTVHFGKDYKNKRRLTLEPTAKGDEPREYLIPKGKHIHLQDGDVIEKGDYIVEGNPAPHDILAIKGVEELAAYLVNEIQEVYRLQGVNINDKHIEVIVRQMLQKVETKPAIPSCCRASRSTGARWTKSTSAWKPRARNRRAVIPCCSASPRRACRPARSSRRRRSRRPRACSPRPPSTARRIRSTGSRRTSSSAV